MSNQTLSAEEAKQTTQFESAAGERCVRCNRITPLDIRVNGEPYCPSCADAAASQVPAICDRCGNDCAFGMYELRYFGPKDELTGWQDQEVVCLACAEDQDEQLAMQIDLAMADEDDYAYRSAE